MNIMIQLLGLSIIYAFYMYCAAFILLHNYYRAVRIVGEIWGTAVSKLIAYDSLDALHTLLGIKSSNRTSATDTLINSEMQNLISFAISSPFSFLHVQVCNSGIRGKDAATGMQRNLEMPLLMQG